MNEKTVLAIDPGTSKCGMAVLTRLEDGKMVIEWRAVVPPDKVIPKLHEAYAARAFNLVVVGSGTGHRDVVATASMQTPPDPVDDYVAAILAERVLSNG